MIGRKIIRFKDRRVPRKTKINIERQKNKRIEIHRYDNATKDRTNDSKKGRQRIKEKMESQSNRKKGR